MTLGKGNAENFKRGNLVHLGKASPFQISTEMTKEIRKREGKNQSKSLQRENVIVCQKL